VPIDTDTYPLVIRRLQQHCDLCWENDILDDIYLRGSS
jgi:hypothetical protein